MPTTQSEDPNEQVDHPRHYNAHPSGIECIEVIEHMPCNVANAMKYIWRCGLKKSSEPERDRASAAWYVRREIDRRRRFGGQADRHYQVRLGEPFVGDSAQIARGIIARSPEDDLIARCLEHLLRDESAGASRADRKFDSVIAHAITAFDASEVVSNRCEAASKETRALARKVRAKAWRQLRHGEPLGERLFATKGAQRNGARCAREEGAMSYDDWIATWVSQRPFIRGLCGSATKAMAQVFPELEIVAGWVNFRGGRSEHFWCVAPDGSIVDPTASQFSGELEYQPFAPGDEVRVGKCLNCGAEIYASVERLDDASQARSVCSSECASELEAGLSPDAYQERGPLI